MIVTIIFFAICLLLIIVLYVLVNNLSNDKVKYPANGNIPTGKPNLTYYYNRSDNDITMIQAEDLGMYLPVFYQTVYSSLYKTGTDTPIGSYSSATTILGYKLEDIITLYECLFPPLLAPTQTPDAQKTYKQSLIDTMKRVALNNPVPYKDIDSCINDFNNIDAKKSGFAVLSISDGTMSGTLTYVLNNTASLSLNPTYFPNKNGDVTVYDIVGGTGSFLGKKGYIYIDETTDPDKRTINIYYK